jgi:UDP-3-O-[3-hydroxymyristoyl] glucosamine N-acyltransferase
MKVSELARITNSHYRGDGEALIERVANLDHATEREIAYVDNEKFFSVADESKAGCLIVPFGDEPRFEGRTVIAAGNPKLAFAQIGAVLHPNRREPSIHPTAVVAETAVIAPTAYVGPNVSVGEYVSVGEDCILHPNVVLYDRVTIGNRVILHAGVCIGADGFGYVRHEQGYQKFPQIGTVVVEDDVEMGAYTCVDRAALGRTRIGRGTKLDNMVHVGHNCDIGEHVVIAAQTGISGSVVIEDDAVIGGQVGFGDHTRVQKGAIIGSKAGILPGKIVRPGVWWGIPVQPLEKYKRMNFYLNRLAEMHDEIKQLRQQVDELKNKG